MDPRFRGDDINRDRDDIKEPNMNTSDRIIVALDTPTLEEAEKLLEELKGVISFYKIGFEFFTAHGWKAVELVKKHGGRIFLDLKLHDIPNTAAKTAAVICDHDVDMFNVHALGGLAMMREVRKTVDQKTKGKKNKPVVIAVTILTSHSPESLSAELNIFKPLRDQVCHLAGLASQAGLDGVVCSPREAAFLRSKFPKPFCLVTPGIRPEGSDKGDQQRTLTPLEAIQAGVDYMVIGRPITASADPRKTALSILNSTQ